jgi:LuxR family maltose regulon positive regulatory protein
MPDAGWAALAEGRWEPARRAFAEALKVEETPERLEGLSWAAWWLDDEETVFEAREQAFRLYRSTGDASGAARMATWLAADHLDFHGAAAVANGWFRRARRLLATEAPRADHGWLDFHEGYVALRHGDTARSSEFARRASRIGRRFDTADLEMLGLALEGSALVTCAKVREGMRCLDEATAVALETEPTIPISRAWACCFLVTACEAVRDYTRAFEWCDRIAEFVERYGSRYILGFCQHHYAMIHVWRGHWQGAEAQFQAAVDAYSRARPAYVGGALAGLAELRRRQGRFEDAERLLGQSAALVCRSRLALDRGDARQALELAERALRQTPGPIVMNRAPALEALVAAAVERGKLQQAHAALKELKEVARFAGTVPLRAAVHLADGIVAAATKDHERARPLLEDAVDDFEQSGAPFEAAEARLELAKSLVALGRGSDASQEAQRSLASLTDLGAEAAAARARTLLDTSAIASRPQAVVPEVSRRERDVLRCLAEGLTNRQIAARLFVSEHTIHRHVTSILRKLDLRTRTAAAAHAVRAGLLDASVK